MMKKGPKFTKKNLNFWRDADASSHLTQQTCGVPFVLLYILLFLFQIVAYLFFLLSSFCFVECIRIDVE